MSTVFAGAIIGIPPTYGYKTLDEVHASKPVVNHKRIDEDSPAGKSLCNSLLLSDKAKMFGIAREVMHTNDNHVYVKSCMYLAMCLAAYYTGRYCEKTKPYSP